MGRIVVEKLAVQGKKVIGLRLPGDKAHLLPEVESAILIHCAGFVTVASKEDKVWNEEKIIKFLFISRALSQ